MPRAPASTRTIATRNLLMFRPPRWAGSFPKARFLGHRLRHLRGDCTPSDPSCNDCSRRRAGVHDLPEDSPRRLSEGGITPARKKITGKVGRIANPSYKNSPASDDLSCRSNSFPTLVEKP